MGPLKLTPLGYQQLNATALEAAVGLTPPANANMCVFSPSGAAVSWRDDSAASSVTATNGIQVANGTFYEYYGDLNSIMFILVSGTPVLNVSYYRTAG